MWRLAKVRARRKRRVFNATCFGANAAKQRGAGGYARPSLDKGHSSDTPTCVT